MAAIGRIKVLNAGIVYRDCSVKSRHEGTTTVGDVYEYVDFVNGWYKIGNNRWVPALNPVDPSKIMVEQTIDNPHGSPEPVNSDSDGSVGSGIADFIDNIPTTLANAMDAAKSKYTDADRYRLLSFESMGYMHGMPYQFTPWVDIRPNVQPGSSAGDSLNPFDYGSMRIFGRKYAEKIGTRTPMLVIQAGDPLYLGGASQEESEQLLAKLDAAHQGMNLKENINLSDPPKYYAFRNNGAEYFKYVSTLCHAAAINMNLYNGKYKGFDGESPCMYYGKDISAMLKSLNSDYKSSDEAKFANSWEFQSSVAFYVNSDTQVSESLSNSTAPSMLAEGVNQISNMGREVQFLLGSNSAELAQIVNSSRDMFTGGLNSIANNISSSGSLLSAITGSMNNIMAGGKMIFPEIWSDSAFGRDYQVSIKLTSPDNDDLSLYHNIIVPLMHLLAFALPRGSSSNSYVPPFLIRAAYKSFFHIDMGIVTSMSITRGAEGCWNRHGIPTTIEVQMGFKELYGIMNMAQASGLGGITNSYEIMQNDMLLSYIGNMCGINLMTDDVSRYIELAAMMHMNGPLYSAASLDDSVMDYLGTKITKMFS